MDSYRMMQGLIVSIIMASYNSERTIERSLKSIKNQDILQDQVEIIVIDGGSDDRTVEIARKYNCIVLENPDRLPEYAKRIGLKSARGKYVQIMDSDEVLPSKDILRKRIEFIERHKEVKCMLGGLSCPKGWPSCGHYINNIGDPFTAFVYDWYIDGNMGLIKKNNVSEDQDGYIGRFGSEDIIPIGDSVTLMDRKFLFDNYGQSVDTDNTATIFQYIVHDTHYVGHMKGDYVLHYTKSDIHTYFRKLKFRVINNIFDVKGSGYAARCIDHKKLNRRKFLYPLYCASILMPIIDGIRMSRYYSRKIYLMHPIFTWYVMAEIMIQYVKKWFGKKSRNQIYG